MSISAFERCLARVFVAEGGYVDHPSDPGGATNLGITRRTLAAWRGIEPWWHLDKQAVRQLGRQEAADIYLARFWRPCGGDAMPAGLDLAVFDFAVHSGPKRAVRALQVLVGAVPDGIVGTNTKSALAGAVRKSGIEAVLRRFFSARLKFLKRLPHYRKFARGWRARISTMRSASLLMVKSAAQESPTQPRTQTMDLLSGYKTYLVGLMMILAALAQLAGVDLPGLEGQSATQLLLQALGLVFLRRGVAKTSV